MKIVFPEQTRCPGSEYAVGFLWLSLLRVEKQKSMFDILDQKWFLSSKIKNSQCGEVRPKKFFQIPKELIKTLPMTYFLSQTDNMSLIMTRMTCRAECAPWCFCSKSNTPPLTIPHGGGASDKFIPLLVLRALVL